jgi:hypothetical protein
MGVRLDAPTIETIFLVTFYEITNLSFAPFLKTGAEGEGFEPLRNI